MLAAKVALCFVLVLCVAAARPTSRVMERAQTASGGNTAGDFASAATQAVLGNIAGRQLQDLPASIPAPVFSKAVKCRGCLATAGLMVNDAAGQGKTETADLKAAALALCSGATFDSQFVPVCQYLSDQALFMYTRLSKNDSPLEVCAALTFCDLSDAGMLQAIFTPIRGKNF